MVDVTIGGTPSFMSLGVRCSEPYIEESGIRAVEYVPCQLCMLKHAYEPKSLLRLVFMSVSDHELFPPINLIHKLPMAKVEFRPSINEVFANLYVEVRLVEHVTYRTLKVQSGCQRPGLMEVDGAARHGGAARGAPLCDLPARPSGRCGSDLLALNGRRRRCCNAWPSSHRWSRPLRMVSGFRLWSAAGATPRRIASLCRRLTLRRRARESSIASSGARGVWRQRLPENQCSRTARPSSRTSPS